VPVHPAHPDPEELAAWQAGDLSGPDGVRVEAHVAACADCAGRVAAVGRGREALAGLGEVDLPPGLHERLAATIEAEVTAVDADSQERRAAAAPVEVTEFPGASTGSSTAAEPVPLDGRRRARRTPAGRRRIAVLSTAAAIVLLVAGLVPVLRHMGGGTVATQTASGGAAPSALSGSGEGSIPVFSAPGAYSGAALQSALGSDPAVRSAYQRAANAAARPSTAAPEIQRDSGGERAAPSAGASSADNSTKGPQGGSAGAGQAPSDLRQAACVATARSQARDKGLQPAFFVNTVYRDRPATVLVTVRPGEPAKAVLWAFPIGDCSAPPFARETVTVTPP
jgi:hypothetical protein